MVHLEKEQKQQFCKNCREVLVGSYEKTEVNVKQRGSITEKCGNCHKERNYMTKDGYGKQLKERMENTVSTG
uniref:Cytochrome C-type biogenesis protein n=1 Tax=Caenorhabditis tropicalis TaxID=1561998 RepID=A0A1I7UH74_9PELO